MVSAVKRKYFFGVAKERYTRRIVDEMRIVR